MEDGARWLSGFVFYELRKHFQTVARSPIQPGSDTLLDTVSGEEAALPDPLSNRRLRDCLHRLPQDDLRILELYYGFVLLPQGPHSPERTLNDEEMTAWLNRTSESHWTLDQVRKRRQRATNKVRQCLERKLGEDRGSKRAPSGAPAATSDPGRPAKMDNTEGPDRETEGKPPPDRADTEDDGKAQQGTIPEIPLDVVEAQLLRLGWEQADDTDASSEGQGHSLHPDLEARYLQIAHADDGQERDAQPKTHDTTAPERPPQGGLELVPTGPKRPNARNAWHAPLLALAAGVAVAAGIGVWREHASGPDIVFKGDEWPMDARLAYRPAGASPSDPDIVIAPTPGAEGRLVATVPWNSRVNLFVRAAGEHPPLVSDDLKISLSLIAGEQAPDAGAERARSQHRLSGPGPRSFLSLRGQPLDLTVQASGEVTYAPGDLWLWEITFEGKRYLIEMQTRRQEDL